MSYPSKKRKYLVKLVVWIARAEAATTRKQARKALKKVAKWQRKLEALQVPHPYYV